MKFDEGPLGEQVRLLTVAEVAGVLRVSNMTVYRLIKGGELPALRIGKHYRIVRRDLDAYLERGVVRRDESKA